jgi:hypothetical protein
MRTHCFSDLPRGLAAALLLTLAPGCIIVQDDVNDDVGTETESTDDATTSTDDATTSTDDEATTSTDDATTESTDDPTTESTDDATTETTAETGTETTAETGTETTGGALSFETDVYPILMSNCGCHVAGASGMLAMPNAGTAFDNLVDVPSAGDPGFIRVAPGDSANSYLLMKLTGTQTVGSSMPFGGGMLPAQDIATITMWIDEGAAP